MYIELPSGTRYPDGYIVPCEVTERESGGKVYVILTAAGIPYGIWVHWDDIYR